MKPAPSALLDWYDSHRRSLPWRAPAGAVADPYHVWISEIMLQQTTVTAVIPYYQRFLDRFPTVDHLARAPLDDVLAAWSGLGYYSRARNLHRCAAEIVRRGTFPRDIAQLKELPGIGAYTSAAIAAIAFGVPVVPVDGNVERVTARLFAIEAPLPGARKALAERAATLNTAAEAQERPSDFAQALFDLGAGLCTPRSPACVLCPWRDSCEGRRRGIQAALPRKAPKQIRPQRFGAHFLLYDNEGRFLLRRRPEQGLLGGTMELPGTTWRDTAWTLEEADGPSVLPFGHRMPAVEWRLGGTVRHVFSHFELFVDVYVGHVRMLPNPTVDEGVLTTLPGVRHLGISSLMRKCLEKATSSL